MEGNNCVREASRGAVVIVHTWGDKRWRVMAWIFSKKRQIWGWRGIGRMWDVKNGNEEKTQSIKTPKFRKFSCIKGIILEYLTYLLNWAPSHCKDKDRDNITIGIFATGSNLKCLQENICQERQSASANLI